MGGLNAPPHLVEPRAAGGAVVLAKRAEARREVAHGTVGATEESGAGGFERIAIGGGGEGRRRVLLERVEQRGEFGERDRNGTWHRHRKLLRG
jgi:hypothetical protein